jgi:hypothetical protein
MKSPKGFEQGGACQLPAKEYRRVLQASELEQPCTIIGVRDAKPARTA